MCGRYVQTKIARYKARVLELAHEAEPPPRAESWNVAPTTRSLAVRLTTEGRVADWLTWGLQGSAPFRIAPGAAHGDPDFTDDLKGDTFRPINARIESVAEKPFFREPWRSRRCLIPADGWYEWKLDGNSPRSRKQPYYFHRRDGQPLFLAALWTNDTYCLLTAPADGDLLQVHHRRPLTLRDESAASWLTTPTTPYAAIAAAVPPQAIAFHPVSPQVSNARQEGPELLVPVSLMPNPDFLPGFDSG